MNLHAFQHGLDLTCWSNGCLNLTSHQQQPNPPRQGPSSNMTAVNLTHQPTPQNHHSNYNNSRTNNNDRRETCEVGLNLSLQNGMNLSVRQAYYYNEGDFETNYTAFEQQTTTQQHRTNQSSTVLMPHEAHRYSPLNLEHRSSPLNLTHFIFEHISKIYNANEAIIV